MKRFPLVTSIFLAGSIACAHAQKPEEPDKTPNVPGKIKSFIPQEKVEHFVINRLNLATFRNSLGSRRRSGMRYFAELGIKPTKIEQGRIEFDLNDWYYEITILRRADENSDGIEDLVIRFVDQSKPGTYQTQHEYLVTSFGNDGSLIAIAYEPRKR